MYTVLFRQGCYMTGLFTSVTDSRLFLHVHISRKQSRRFLMHPENRNSAADRLHNRYFTQKGWSKWPQLGSLHLWSPEKTINGPNSPQKNLWDMPPPCGHTGNVYSAMVEFLKVPQLTNLSCQPRVHMMIVVIYTLFSVWINTKNIRDASIYSSNISELAEESCTFV